MREPRRIQRSRALGSRMPEGSVYVGRPTKWGNPFRPDLIGADLALALYRDLLTGWTPGRLSGWPHEDVASIYALHSAWSLRIGRNPTDAAQDELRGLDLSCWCRLDAPCHADILLEIANR